MNGPKVSGKEVQAMRLVHITLWPMFFIICFGLGYPSLDRFDPTKIPGLVDSVQYFRLVVDGPEAAEGHFRYRVLVPYLAKPIYHVAVGRLGTWNPISFSLLVVDSAFCASSSVLLIWVAQGFGLSLATGLIAAFCYLLNFQVANFQLAGSVDAGEGFFFICLLLALQRRSWIALPVLGVLGALAKETFVPVAFLFGCGWVYREKRVLPWLQIGGLALTGIAAVVMIRSMVEGHLVTPLQIAGSERAVYGSTDILRNAFHALKSWVMWITVLWLVPLVIYGMARLPSEAVSASVLGLAAAFALAVWNDSGPNSARPLFNIAGPCLCLAFASGVTKVSATKWPGSE
jgi:hypothetical protein